MQKAIDSIKNAQANLAALAGRGDDAHNENINSATGHLNDVLEQLGKPLPKAKKKPAKKK